jgi:hypothetical protein
MFNFVIDPIKLEKTTYEAGFQGDDGSDKENYPSRIPFEQAPEIATRSPKNVVRKKDKPKPKPNPSLELANKIQKVSFFTFRDPVLSFPLFLILLSFCNLIDLFIYCLIYG